MADDVKKFTQAEVDAIIAEHKEQLVHAREDAAIEGVAEGINRCYEWLDGRATQLEQADKDRGYFEAEIAILRWASKRVGAL